MDQYKVLFVSPEPQKEIDTELVSKVMSNIDLDFTDRGDDTAGACWIWKGTINNSGYGQVNFRASIDGKDHNGAAAHRLTYRIWKGVIADRNTVNHLCMVPGTTVSRKDCVNPKHLEQMSQKANSREAYSRKAATSFIHGFLMGRVAA